MSHANPAPEAPSTHIAVPLLTCAAGRAPLEANATQQDSAALTICSYAGTYASIVAGKNGQADYHLFLLAGATANATWEDAAAYAAGRGGALPTREEMTLIGELDNEIYSGPYWTADRIDGNRAMAYSFSSGIEGYSHTSCEFMARVVRRDPIEVWANTVVALPAKAPIILAANEGALLDAELWPEDSELVAEIRAMFMTNWGMDRAQADARMSRFDFKTGLAALEGGAA